MKRTGFARPAPKPAKVYEVHTPRARECAVYDGKARLTLSLPRPKDNAIQHRGYMDAVRRMACAHCGRAGPSQFCHSDLGGNGNGGKGAHYKSDCRLGWPGCADRPGARGCHSLIGSAGTFTRFVRHRLEAELSRKTRADVVASGQWPKDLPLWVEEVEQTA